MWKQLEYRCQRSLTRAQGPHTPLWSCRCLLSRCQQGSRARLLQPLGVAAGDSGGGEGSNTEKRTQRNSALTSLDQLLGSRDEEDDIFFSDAPSSKASTSGYAGSSMPALPRRGSASRRQRKLQGFVFRKKYVYFDNEDVVEPKVWPLMTYAIYYIQIAAYAAYLAAGKLQGPDAADQYFTQLTNDHLAVLSSGEVYRFFTCIFVVNDPVQLFVTLLAFVTLAPELEAIFGYSAFASVIFSAVLTSSVSDAVLEILPVTQGAFPAIAGMIGALLAHQAKNWDMGIQAQDAKRAFEASHDGDEEVEIEILEGLVKFERHVPREGRALLVVAGTAVAAFQALTEVSDSIGGGDSFTSWAGLGTAAAVGAVLALLIGPRYKIRRATKGEMIESEEEDLEDSSTKAGSTLPQEQLSQLGNAVVLTDDNNQAQRAFAALGYNVALFLVVMAWMQGAGGGQ